MPNSMIWNARLVRDCFEAEDATWILQWCIPSVNTDDRLIWAAHPKGSFSVRSGYPLLGSVPSSALSDFSSTIWKKLWSSLLQDRLKLLLWKIAWNALPCKVNTHRVAGAREDDLHCPFCLFPAKSVVHLFFECPAACILWFESPCVLNLHELPPRRIGEWILAILDAPASLNLPVSDGQRFVLFAAVLMDSIWFTRNQIIHSTVLFDLSVLINRICAIYLEHSFVWKDFIRGKDSVQRRRIFSLLLVPRRLRLLGLPPGCLFED